MAMSKHLNVFIPNELLAQLDAFAAKRDLNRSEAARLALGRVVNMPEFYEAPTLPDWRVESYTLLLRGLFGDERLVLTDGIKALLVEALAKLNEREEQVLRLRLGLNGPRHMLEEVGAIFGVNRQRMHQVEALALQRMRYWLRTSGIWELLGPQLDKEEHHEKPGLSNSQ